MVRLSQDEYDLLQQCKKEYAKSKSEDEGITIEISDIIAGSLIGIALARFYDYLKKKGETNK